jgi:hypothetical protein
VESHVVDAERWMSRRRAVAQSSSRCVGDDAESVERDEAKEEPMASSNSVQL